MGSALVLGGGGVTGIAWTTGLLLGLAEAGVDVTDAGLVVGTSAGAAVGAQVATGRSLAELYDVQLDSRTSELAAVLDLEALAPIFREMQEGLPLGDEARARIGAMALEATTVGEPERRAVIEARLGIDEWPVDGRLRITAIDAATGAFVVFDGSDGTGLIDAVAASCAVPGVWPPVTVRDRRYIDGGVRSVVNADVADGADPVLLVVPLSAISQVDISGEVGALETAGARTLVLRPDDEAQSAMGVNPLDPARRRPAAEAGRRQAAAFAAAVGDLWLPSDP
jgi:NTE family protein